MILLALEQRKTLLKALARKDDCVVQYTLYRNRTLMCKEGGGYPTIDRGGAKNINWQKNSALLFL